MQLPMKFDQVVDTYRAVWLLAAESRPLSENPESNGATLSNQVVTTSRPRAADELNIKALTVLRAARTVFLTHGFSAATADMIQREAGVSSPRFTRYANKEALFTAVIEARMCGVHGIRCRASSSRQS